MSRAGRKIHPRAPWAIPGSNVPAPVPWQQPAQLAPQPAPSVGAAARRARRTAPQRPFEGMTFGQALDGLMRAGSESGPQLVTPRFKSTAGPWLQLGEHQIRVPPNVAISVSIASAGHHYAVLAHLDGSDEEGRVQVLLSVRRGVLELVGLPPEALRDARSTCFGK